jgi:sulfur carrier protein
MPDASDTLKPTVGQSGRMRVTVDVVGDATYEVDVTEDATYADLLEPVEYSQHQVSIMVDGRPVPEDQPVDSESVRVVRLVQGG